MHHQKPENKYSEISPMEAYWQDLLDSLSVEFGATTEKPVPLIEWVQRINLGAQKFSFEGHEFQKAILEEDARKQCMKKGAQMGFTELVVQKTLHGMIYRRYPQGVLILFPSQLDVQDFSRARFGSIIGDNPQVANQVRSTDAVGIKQIGRRSVLYLRGARSTARIEGIKKTSSQLKAIGVDRVVFDECDEMDPAMLDLAVERMGHSLIKEEVYLSTPSIPDFGIDKLYQESDQRVWAIKCQRCNTETVSEIEFPNSLEELSDGRVLRVCRKCRQEIHPRDGRWVAQYPDRSKDMVGWWISQLNSAYVDPREILRAYNDPPHGNLQEVMNSKLASAHISAENRLTVNDIYGTCDQDPMDLRHEGPCCMGVDVGNVLHVLVGYKPKDRIIQISYMARVSEWNELHDIAKRFNVDCCVIDLKPEIRKVREFQRAESFKVFACDYQEHQRGVPAWDENTGIVTVNRTEACDWAVDLVRSGELIIPRRCQEVEEFAKQMSNIAKVLEEDQVTGSREYRYRKLGVEHYFHALVYLILASEKVITAPSRYDAIPRQAIADSDYDPLSW